jgi:hypothetical protein
MSERDPGSKAYWATQRKIDRVATGVARAFDKGVKKIVTFEGVNEYGKREFVTVTSSRIPIDSDTPPPTILIYHTKVKLNLS